jgi:exodeoxyribonuclease VII small subunit
MSTKKDFDFTKKYDDFKKLLEWFESDDIDLAIAPKKFQEAKKLADELKAYLSTAENEIKKVTKDFDT